MLLNTAHTICYSQSIIQQLFNRKGTQHINKKDKEKHCIRK